MGSAGDERLAISECRRLLGAAAPESDDVVAVLRDQLYDLAMACLFARGTLDVPMDAAAERYEFDERAAILQFDAKLPRQRAEAIAAMRTARHRRK